MSNTRVSNAAAIAALDALLDLLDSGGAGSIEIRTGAPPSTCEAADSGTLLAVLPLSNPAFNGATDGTDKATASAGTITADSSANADGTAAHFRAKNGSGTVVIQGDVTATGAGGDIQLTSTNILTGDAVSISSWVFNLPEQ